MPNVRDTLCDYIIIRAFFTLRRFLDTVVDAPRGNARRRRRRWIASSSSHARSVSSLVSGSQRSARGLKEKRTIKFHEKINAREYIIINHFLRYYINVVVDWPHYRCFFRHAPSTRHLARSTFHRLFFIILYYYYDYYYYTMSREMIIDASTDDSVRKLRGNAPSAVRGAGYRRYFLPFFFYPHKGKIWN